MHTADPAALSLPTLSVDLARAARRSENTPTDWSDADVDRAIMRYRRFLLLVQRGPGRAVAPTRDIDVIWHLHMLSPRAYYADCQRLFGDLLDHDGGFGQTDDERPLLGRVFEATAARWEALFGEPYVPTAIVAAAGGITKCWHDCQSRCWHACKSVEAMAA